MAKFLEIPTYDDQGFVSELGRKMRIIAKLAGGEAETHLAGFEQEYERVIFGDGDVDPDEDEILCFDWLQGASRPGRTNKSLAEEFKEKFLDATV